MRHLDLSGNHFDKDAFKILGALPSLKFLSLKSNRMEGPLSNQGLTSFRHLEILDLSVNNFYASISPSIGALSSLKALFLAQNNLNGSLSIQGNISPSLFGSLNSLEYIGLSHNGFEGLFSFGSFANHSNFEVVELTSDNNKFEVDTELTDWIPLFQLKILVLSNCDLSKLFGDVLKFLLYQNKLMVVDLSHNNLTSSFPNWLLVNNARLQFLVLRNNSFVNLFFCRNTAISILSKLTSLTIT
ncbi:receptor like protein 21-like [Camellia sinensis]|uniref:receptor like protein 21-like n=1 Tax=Camellia sinensis TaxID=4442 RepID=UPI001035CAFF|nr:receptor like protein 21-like [Camellia sinensis]